jgi:tetratricopeptide (TPR) repeat protein
MRRLPALVAALLLPTTPLILGSAVVSATLLVTQAPAQAQSADAVAKVAQAITVRIEGGTQGSGVLVKREGNRYTVLTAWHVVSDQRAGEELDIFVRDGSRQQLEQGSIKRLGEVDLAVLTFASSNSYEVAQIGDIRTVSMGNQVWVSGFPLPSSAIPTRLMRFIKGDVIANATVAIPDGYQLLYDNQTLPGVSGGAVLNAQGQLVGIHGKAEKADQISESSGKAVATGTNQGVPISYYKQYASGAAVFASSPQATSADDYLVQAKALLGMKGREQDVIRLSNQVLATSQSAEAYSYRAFSKSALGDAQGAIDDLTQAIAIKPISAWTYDNRGVASNKIGNYLEAINDHTQALLIEPNFKTAYFNRAISKDALGDKLGSISDFTQAIKIDPKYAYAYYNRGNVKRDLGDNLGAIDDYTQAIAVDPRDADYYGNRGVARSDLGDRLGAINDYSQALTIAPQDALLYNNRAVAKEETGDRQGACSDYKKAASLGLIRTSQALETEAGAWCRNMP